MAIGRTVRQNVHAHQQKSYQIRWQRISGACVRPFMQYNSFRANKESSPLRFVSGLDSAFA